MSRERPAGQTPAHLHCHDHRRASRPDTPVDASVDPTGPGLPPRSTPLTGGAGPRERSVAQAAGGRLSADRSPTVHPGGSGHARTPRASLPRLVQRHAPRPTRDNLALAPTRPPALLASQVQARWSTFLRDHAHATWACDFPQTSDLLFRPIFAFFVIALGSRRVVHVGVTRSPSRPGSPTSSARRRHGAKDRDS